jgi:uncharacterized repeat protein (TIGR03803 family)
MKAPRLTPHIVLALLVTALIPTALAKMAAGQEQVLHSFQNNGEDGRSPWSNLVFDSSGNMWGTTSLGGKSGSGCGGQGCGSVFELVTHKNHWGWHVAYNFRQSDGSGANPLAGVIFDASGNIYGTTQEGGAYHIGTVFELTPAGDGKWTQTLLHSFSYKHEDGNYPLGGLIFDASGNLYGTTSGGGAYLSGTVFELSPGSNGQWTETILYSFCPVAGCPDGANPASSLVFDQSGNLYGTTTGGGTQQSGAVFELTPSSGQWTESTLYSFQNNNLDGVNPYAGLIFDTSGNLYGTTYWGGTYNVGTVFELSPNGQGGWTEAVLYSFNSTGADAQDPYAGLLFDASGNLYGTTQYGGSGTGCSGGCGAIFELSPNAGQWTESVLYSFNDNGVDGYNPAGGLVFDSAGNLYTTTVAGGTDAYGTVIELTP